MGNDKKGAPRADSPDCPNGNVSAQHENVARRNVAYSEIAHPWENRIRNVIYDRSLRTGTVAAMSSGVLLPSSQRRPYYIIAPEYRHVSAGIRVLHLLCHMLNLKGQCAFLTTSIVNSDWIAPILTEAIVQKHFDEKRTPIVIYPETILGNPLQAGCIVRYLLNYPGLLGGPAEFGPDEMLFWYSDQMKRECQRGGLVLSFPATDARIFTPPPEGSVRRGSCFYGEKYKHVSGEKLSPPSEGSIEILREGPGVQTREELLNLFRTSELFYCYESSALSLEAALCGCPVVLIPNSLYTKPLLVEPIGLTGMAWGNSPEEIERAKRTAPQMREKYDEWIESAFRQLHQFIEETQKKALATPYLKIVWFPVYLTTWTNPTIRWMAFRIRRAFWLFAPPIVSMAFAAFNLSLLIWLITPPIVLGSVWGILRSTSDGPQKSWIRKEILKHLPRAPTYPQEIWIRGVVRRCTPPFILNIVWRISRLFCD
jgi:hypothetical protein